MPKDTSRPTVPAPSEERPPARFAHFDPRIHWTWPRTKVWYEEKQTEISQRGNRKSKENFGKAAARMARRKREEPSTKMELPDRVRNDPVRLAAAMELEEMAEVFRKKQLAKYRREKKEKGKVVGDGPDNERVFCIMPGLERAAMGDKAWFEWFTKQEPKVTHGVAGGARGGDGESTAGSEGWEEGRESPVGS